MRRSQADLWITAAVAVVACAAAAADAPVAVMTVLGLVLFVAPGYLLGQLLLGSYIVGLERVAVAAGLMFCVPILGGLLLYAAGLPLHRAAWLSLLAGVTLVCDVALFVRRRSGRSPSPLGQQKGWRLPLRQMAAFAAAVVIAVCGVGLARAGVAKQHYPGYTQLWLDRPNESAATVNLGVRNYEGETMRYRVSTCGPRPHCRYLESHPCQWPGLAFSPRYPVRHKISVNLFRLPDVTQAYRHVALDDNPTSVTANGAQVASDPHRATRPPQWPAPQVGVTAAWRLHKDLLGSATSLIATTGLASVLGFVYWTLAARLFSQEAVGYGSATVSAMTLLGTIGMFGLGTVLIGELPRRSSARVGLISAALFTSCIGSLVLGLGFAVLAAHFSRRFEYISGTLSEVALFTAGVALTGVTLVFDQVTIGLLRGGLQLSRNIILGVIKLLLLPVVAVILHDQFGMGITASWVTGMALSVVLIAIRLRLGGTPVLPRPEWGVLRKLGKTAVAHSWLNLSISVPRSLIPVLVTVIVSPSANAAFYAAWTLAGLLYIVPTHLSTVLFAVASANPKLVARKLRFTLRLSLLIGLPGMVILGLGAHLALSLFGPSYARAATVTLWLLVIGYLPTIPKMHFIAVCRASGRISRAALVLTSAAAMEITAAAIGGATGGLKGLSVALLAVFLVEGLVTTPPVLRAAFGRGRHRQADSPITAASNPAKTERPRDLAPVFPGALHKPVSAHPHMHAETMTATEMSDGGKLYQQEQGIATLLWLARAQQLWPMDR